MTKDEYTQISDKAKKYEEYAKLLDGLNEAINQMKNCESFTLNGRTSYRCTIHLNSRMKDGIISILQTERETISEQINNL